MLLEYQRTGQRRYAIEVRRERFPDLTMDPAPGYDPFLPHDLLHLVVEAALDLDHGIFGQLAAGGDAGTFVISDRRPGAAREEARERRRQQKRGARLARSDRHDSARSERATYVCWQEWLSRSDSARQREQARTMASQARSTRELMSDDESERLDAEMDGICRHLDAISARWSRLEVGQSVVVRWPDLAIQATS